MLWLDLETRSQCNLPAQGLLRYAQDPTTQTICMSYAFGDGDVLTWFHEDGPFPEEVRDYIENSNGPLTAHNAAFERHLFDFVLSNDYDFKPPALTRWQCSSARAMAHGLPGNLKDVCRALGLPLQKQSEGTRLIREYCSPYFRTEWVGDDKRLMKEYCEMDVLTMRQFCSVLRDLTPAEWRQYHITEIMNDRGVPLDIPFVQAALEYADEVRQDVAQQIVKLTNGVIQKPTERKSRDAWLAERLNEDQMALITVTSKEVEKIKFDQEYRQILLKAEDLPDEVAQFIELVEQAGGATISKYKAMANTHVDGRVHGSLVWNGAGATGRFASRGLQLQNFRRDVFKEPEPLIEAVISGAGLDRPAEALGRLIRSAIHTPNGLTFSDYSQIEARVLPWLTGDPAAEKTLDIFRGGRDLYSENAVGMFNLRSIDEVTPDLRQSAKQGVLACLHADSEVVTDTGPKRIVEVELSDLLWDGEQWVEHDGLVYRGKRETVELEGVYLTADHLVRTHEGWKQAQQLLSNPEYLESAKTTGLESLWLLGMDLPPSPSERTPPDNLSSVYDIANAGPNNRFTVLSDSGALVVHNCGFGGGAGAVQAMARGYGMKYTFEQADEIKKAWRDANPWALPFWYGLKDAAKRAVQSPRIPQSHGKLSFMYDGGDWLWMLLPSGRCLAYCKPMFEIVEYPWGDEGWELTCLWGSGKPKAGQPWPRRVLNHLILSENATQAAAADVMREAIVRAHSAGLDVLFSVHDELVVEGHCFDRLHEVMTTPPAWAEGLPIDADTQISYRYGK